MFKTRGTLSRFVLIPLLASTSLGIGASGLRAELASPRVMPGECVVSLVRTQAGIPSSLISKDLANLQVGVWHTPKLKRRWGNQLRVALVDFASTTPAYSTSKQPIPYDPTNDPCKLLETFPGFSSAAPNYVRRALVVPDDPNLSFQWALLDSAPGGINAVGAWAHSANAGANVVVGVVDSGIDYRHPDLAANMWINPDEIPGNNIDDDENGYIDDVHGIDAVSNSGDPNDTSFHGTHVAGIIGAVGNNKRGISGIAWNAKLMALRFLGADGSGSDAEAIECLNYAINQKNRGVNIKVLNNSWGGPGFSQPLHDAISALREAGIMFVAASGNAGLNIDFEFFAPAGDWNPNVVTVGAIDTQGQLTAFSNFGLASVGIGAPGKNILSTFPGGTYGYLTGTSMAAPQLSGVAALLWSEHPDWTVTQVIQRLYQGSTRRQELESVFGTGANLNAAAALRGEIQNPNAHAPGDDLESILARRRPQIRNARIFGGKTNKLIPGLIDQRSRRVRIEYYGIGRGSFETTVSLNHRTCARLVGTFDNGAVITGMLPRALNLKTLEAGFSSGKSTSARIRKLDRLIKLKAIPVAQLCRRLGDSLKQVQ